MVRSGSSLGLIFAWRLFLNQVPTKDKLLEQCVLAHNDQGCVVSSGANDNKDHLFINCALFGGLWSLIAGWLDFPMAFLGSLVNHLHQFGGL